MTAIDSRATITCNLGEVISGGISDSYLQNSGLVFTRGQLTLAGISTPAIGSQVTISYAMNSGASGEIPRSLVVLSAFADPFREITEVSVGCKLTYLDGVMPVPSLEDGDAAYVGPRQMECLNGVPPSAFVPPIFADQLFNYCLEKLGLFGSADLKGTYVMDKYNLSGGYVMAISNLLLSEGKVGFVDQVGRLEVVDLSQKPASSNYLSNANIIEVSSVNSGEQPASIVIVPYIDKKLQTYKPEEAQWDEVETIGNPESVKLQYTGGSLTVTHTPTSKTVTEYGPPSNLTDQCELKDGGFGDLSNTVVRTTTERTTVLGHAAGGYATALLDEGKPVNTDLQGTIVEVTSHEFDEKDRPLRTVTETYEPFFVYAGRMSLEWILEDGSFVVLGNEPLLVERSITEFAYAGAATVPEGLRPGQDVPEPVVYQREHRYTYQAWGKTQGGSQGPAESTTLEAFGTSADVVNYVQGSLGLVLTDSEVQSNKAFNPKGQRRPGESDRAVNQGTLDNVGRSTKYVELQMEFADEDASRVVQYSPPHLTESYFTSTGLAVNVDSYAVSANFGRCQHRLAAGNRLGMNITSTPENLALEPYAALTVAAAGYTAQYAVNGLNFSFGRDGIVASVDALYIGGKGLGGGGRKLTKKARAALGPCWFYLPNGYDPNDLPLADEGQLIPPFNERVNVVAGTALGIRVQAQRAQNLVLQTVEIGVALGIDGSNANYKQLIEVGVASGISAESSQAFINDIQIGVWLGTDAQMVLTETVELGVKAGVNIGPKLEAPTLLLHFDDLNPGENFSETLWVDSSPNGIVLENTNPGGMATFTSQSNTGNGVSRFGDAFAVFKTGLTDVIYWEDRGGLLSGRTTDLNLGSEWTIEFWLYLDPAYMPASKPAYDWILLSMDNSNTRNPIAMLCRFNSSNQPFLGAWYKEDGYSFTGELNGGVLPIGRWVHVGLCKSAKTITLIQDGSRADSWSSNSDWETWQVDRLAMGGGLMLESEDFFRAQGMPACKMDEFRIMGSKAVYPSEGSNYEIPTGPFT